LLYKDTNKLHSHKQKIKKSPLFFFQRGFSLLVLSEGFVSPSFSSHEIPNIHVTHVGETTSHVTNGQHIQETFIDSVPLVSFSCENIVP
jgi:hypothetical protein